MKMYAFEERSFSWAIAVILILCFLLGLITGEPTLFLIAGVVYLMGTVYGIYLYKKGKLLIDLVLALGILVGFHYHFKVHSLGSFFEYFISGFVLFWLFFMEPLLNRMIKLDHWKLF